MNSELKRFKRGKLVIDEQMIKSIRKSAQEFINAYGYSALHMKIDQFSIEALKIARKYEDNLNDLSKTTSYSKAVIQSKLSFYHDVEDFNDE